MKRLSLFKSGLVALVLAVAGSGCGPTLMKNHSPGQGLKTFKEEKLKVSKPVPLRGLDYFVVDANPAELEARLKKEKGYTRDCQDFVLVPVYDMGRDNSEFLVPENVWAVCESDNQFLRSKKVPMYNSAQAKQGYSVYSHEDLLKMISDQRSPLIKGKVFYLFNNFDGKTDPNRRDFYMVPEEQIDPKALNFDGKGPNNPNNSQPGVYLYIEAKDGKIYQVIKAKATEVGLTPSKGY